LLLALKRTFDVGSNSFVTRISHTLRFQKVSENLNCHEFGEDQVVVDVPNLKLFDTIVSLFTPINWLFVLTFVTDWSTSKVNDVLVTPRQSVDADGKFYGLNCMRKSFP
jgi:hypothetical protein